MVRESAGRPVTIDDLRRDWRRAIEQYDDMIAWLEGGGTIHPIGESAERATQAWLEKLRHWRKELETLLQTFPGNG